MNSMASNWETCWLPSEETDSGAAVRTEGFDASAVIGSAVRELEAYGTFRAGEELTIRRDASLPAESYRYDAGDKVLTAGDESGALYGAFHLLREQRLQNGEASSFGPCIPSNPLRMLNHWDNMDGSIERGYSGRSFFFADGAFLTDEASRERLKYYARLIASVGINAVVINNVNVKDNATWLISDRFYDNLIPLSELFYSYGIRLFLSLNYAACMDIGGLPTADPLDASVQAWWQDKMREVFEKIPHFGGFLVKADSEGRPGPFTYGRTQADGANMLAAAAAPYGGIIIWRCFVYNCRQDWRDKKTDRACAGYDSFIGTDGDYADNVILQIKNGPMDFQIREPVSPLFGGLKKTNTMLEVQIAQEYTGQQIDLCYLIPMFREVLDFHTSGPDGDKDTVADIIAGRAEGHTVVRGMSGIAAVTNTGNDANWTGSDLAQANLYGFGRLAFDPTLSAEAIAREFLSLCYPARSREVLLPILLNSRRVYEDYSAPLGIGWMVFPATHYGPSVDGYEYDRWGTYHRADHLGLGVDRTKNGTGYTAQYPAAWEEVYEDPGKCPEELLLFFHRVLYTAKLKSGKTLIQHIYDTHFAGLEAVEESIRAIGALKDDLDPVRYARIMERLERQRVNAREWCDQVNSYFYRKCGIPDEKGRE
ncbi:MAG: alpha-glucuronidase, partial [Lachnospiraceae bacterium]|nr:alpha-glucuronidase [Lachnospiraceae bacterium]